MVTIIFIVFQIQIKFSIRSLSPRRNQRIVSIGAVFALMTSLLGAMFPLPRVLYAMSSDGLLYSIFKRVNKRTQTPVYATLLAGLLAAILALVLNLQQLIEMMSLGTLMVAIVVVIFEFYLKFFLIDISIRIQRHTQSWRLAFYCCAIKMRARRILRKHHQHRRKFCVKF